MKELFPQECLLCHSNLSDELLTFNEPDQYERAVDVSAQDYARKWVQCQDCGFIYSRYSRAEDQLDKIYQSAYRREGGAWRSGNVEQIFDRITKLPEAESETKIRIKWIKTRIAELIKNGILPEKSAPGLFLDIGGGNGIFAYEFQDEEWKGHVVDPDENGRFIQERFKIPFIQEYYRPGIFGKKFDLISLVFVLEHLRRPDIFLQDVRQDMRDGSLLYIEVPDAICFKVKDHTDDIFNSCHLWMFSPNTLVRLLDACELEIFSLDRGRTKRGHMSITVLAGVKNSA